MLTNLLNSTWFVVHFDFFVLRLIVSLFFVYCNDRTCQSNFNCKRKSGIRIKREHLSQDNQYLVRSDIVTHSQEVNGNGQIQIRPLVVSEI